MKFSFNHKSILRALTLSLILSFISCDKDPFDLFDDFKGKLPVVSTDSVYLVGGDTFAVTGHIVSKGGAELDLAGICFDKQPNPSEMTNQVLFADVDKNFTAYIASLDEDSTYYFKTFAAKFLSTSANNT